MGDIGSLTVYAQAGEGALRPLAGLCVVPSARPGKGDGALDVIASAEYLPMMEVDNAHFSALTSREPDWFAKVTGIHRRRRAASGENANTMAINAVARLAQGCPGILTGVDLIVAASYTPWDTVGTMAHAVQRAYDIHGARAIYLSTACSSYINALELVSAYVQTGRSRRALVVAAEHNSLYARDDDDRSGHLWGDGAIAMCLAPAETSTHGVLRLVDVETCGLGDLGGGPDAVYLHPRGAGLVMPMGKDVFFHACREIEAAARQILVRNGLHLDDVRLFVPHQANDRIITHVQERLGLSDERVARTIGDLGNTGCAGAPIALMRHQARIGTGEWALMVTFGGGYSMGAALFRRSP